MVVRKMRFRFVTAQHLTVAAVVAATVFLCTPVAQADSLGKILFGSFDEGDWRAEFTVTTGLNSGRRDRTGDWVTTASLEYGWPIANRWEFGLRAFPLFWYEQDDPSETLLGGGGGLSLRYYFNREHHGWYGETGIAALFHKNQYDGNSSNFNFMPEASLGYDFRNNWHVAVKFRHLSNGGLGDDNSGANSIGLAVGYRF
jgi:hypothetical protein